jgi:hypothetical protein
MDGRGTEVVSPRASAWVVGPAAVAFAVSQVGGCPNWVAPLLLCLLAFGTLGRPLVHTTVAASRRLAAESQSWADALVLEETADIAHLRVSGPVRAIADARAVAIELGAAALEHTLTVEELSCREVAREWLREWEHIEIDAERCASGFLGGAPGFVTPRSATSLHRWATVESTPPFLPLRARVVIARSLRPVDVIRLLHTPQIERSALIATLWLRAAILIAAPIAGGLSLTGTVPLRAGASTGADVLFYVACGIALIAALLAPAIATRAMDPDRRTTRWTLFIGEEAVGLALVAVSPCWMVAVFLAGAVNWLERPDWRLVKLIAWVAVNLGVLAVAAVTVGHANVGQAALETLIAAAAITVIGCSYGLMLPAVASTLLTLAILDRRREHRVDALASSGRKQVIAALEASTFAMRTEIERLDDTVARRDLVRRAEDALTGLARERRQLDDRPGDPRGRTRSFVDLCAQALAAVVPPVGIDEEAHLHSATIDCFPTDVGRLVVERRRDARALVTLIKQLGYEAAGRGEGLLYPRLGVDGDGRILVTLANEFSAAPRTGFGTGARWIERKVSAIPGARLMQRGAADGLEFGTRAQVFIVTVALERGLFTKSA